MHHPHSSVVLFQLEQNTMSNDDAHVIQDPASAACALVMADTMLAVVSAAIDQFNGFQYPRVYGVGCGVCVV
jgi:hypothetical protein